MLKRFMMVAFFAMIILIPHISIFSQSNSTLLIETHYFRTEYYSQKIKSNDQIVENTTLLSAWGTSISHSFQNNFLGIMRYELHTGLFIGDLDLLGLDLGFYFRRDIIWKFFGVFGSTFHYNFGHKESHNTWSRSSTGGVYFFTGGGLGFNVSKNISLMLGYYSLSKSNFRSGWSINNRYFESVSSREKLKWLIKIGFELDI